MERQGLAVIFRLSCAALIGAAWYAVVALGLWLLGHLELPPVLQRHHPLVAPLSPMLVQTEHLVLTAIAASGAVAGALWPAHPHTERKWLELQGAANALAIAWTILAATILGAALLESAPIAFFGALAAATAGMLRLAAKAIGTRRHVARAAVAQGA